MTATQTIDSAKAEAFAGHLASTLNGGALSLMISIGHRTGLFDAMSGLESSTSEQIAAAAGLQERYVREWLGAMTVGGIVEHRDGRYLLPAEHAAMLTRAAGPDNLAVTMQFVGLLARVEDEVTACFRQGGGVGYEAYHQFHELMAEESAGVHDAALIDVILPLVPGLPQRLESGIDVADVGCGRGHAVNVMARAYPNSRFVGYDFANEAIEAARAEAEAWGLSNARFDVQDAATLDAPGAFDLVTAFDAVHDQVDPVAVLTNIASALRPDGIFLMVDIKASSDVAGNLEHPLGPFLYTVSTMHCMTVSLAGGGAGLGTVWGEQTARAMLADAGFTSVKVEAVEGDVFNSYYIATK